MSNPQTDDIAEAVGTGMEKLVEAVETGFDNLAREARDLDMGVYVDADVIALAIERGFDRIDRTLDSRLAMLSQDLIAELRKALR